MSQQAEFLLSSFHCNFILLKLSVKLNNVFNLPTILVLTSISGDPTIIKQQISLCSLINENKENDECRGDSRCALFTNPETISQNIRHLRM